MFNIIEVKNLTKKFDEFTAVNGISFNVGEGEIFAFLGPNDAGKTTTTKILTTPAAQDKVGHSFGIVFQNPSLNDELTA